MELSGQLHSSIPLAQKKPGTDLFIPLLAYNVESESMVYCQVPLKTKILLKFKCCIRLDEIKRTVRMIFKQIPTYVRKTYGLRYNI